MDILVFKSNLHPDEQPLVLVHARHLVVPLAVASLPVMIVTLVSMLQGLPVLLLTVAGFALAITLANLWTHYRLRRTPAEVRVRGEVAAIRSIWDVAVHAPLVWGRVFDLRDTSSERTVTVGLTSYDLAKGDWPEMRELTEALQQIHVGRRVWERPSSSGETVDV